MGEVYGRLKKMSLDAIRQYEEEEEAFYRSIFDQIVDVADYASLGKAGEDKCSICLELFESQPCGKLVNKPHLAIQVKCGKNHIFGANCIWDWMKGCRDSARDRGCPICCNKLNMLNNSWNADENWVRIHLDQRRYLKQTHEENARRHCVPLTNHRRNLLDGIPIPKTGWIDFLVETIAALEIAESDLDIIEGLNDAQALLRAFTSLANRSGRPNGIERGFFNWFVQCSGIDVKILSEIRRDGLLFYTLCTTIEHLSIMGQELLPHAEEYDLHLNQDLSACEVNSEEKAKEPSRDESRLDMLPVAGIQISRARATK
jgi:hypothetical protein